MTGRQCAGGDETRRELRLSDAGQRRGGSRRIMPTRTVADNHSETIDTVVNCFLINEGGLDIQQDSIIGVAVETMCNYNKPIAYPEPIDAGLRVGKIGHSSVRFEIGIFRKGDEEAAASGHFIHVFVDREPNAPVPVPDAIRAALEPIQVTI